MAPQEGRSSESADRQNDEGLREAVSGAGPVTGGSGTPLRQVVPFEAAQPEDEEFAWYFEGEPVGGTIGLWQVLMDDQLEFAEELVADGADPWQPVLGGWSPGRLSLAGPVPGLFEVPEGERGLSPAEHAAVHEAQRLRTALADSHHEGLGLACVAGIDAEEAIRRLDAAPLRGHRLRVLQEAPWAGADFDHRLRIVGVTTVPGGCIVTQRWGYTPQASGVQQRLSAGTACYGLYANAKSGNQGSFVRDGVIEGGDLHPGGGPNPFDTVTSEDVLLAYLYRGHPVAHACAWVGLRPADACAVTGQPDAWVELPDRDYWTS
ncbi:ankyrin repeat domain-containing protein [Streptomyces sp. NPDC008001]|uniref:ankyrin repeat domain-containing protein n=1 Tax=Streptomyces sp. NPDC008001 TaxID=3364804 RepID=UPI0036F02F77